MPAVISPHRPVVDEQKIQGGPSKPDTFQDLDGRSSESGKGNRAVAALIPDSDPKPASKHGNVQ
jgi:hypothetical protein